MDAAAQMLSATLRWRQEQRLGSGAPCAQDLALEASLRPVLLYNLGGARPAPPARCRSCLFLSFTSAGAGQSETSTDAP